MGKQLDQPTFTLGLYAEAVQARLATDEREDLPVPARPYSFGVLKHFQALTDLESRRQHGRRGIRVHRHEEAPRGLETFKFYLEPAVEGEPI